MGYELHYTGCAYGPRVVHVGSFTSISGDVTNERAVLPVYSGVLLHGVMLHVGMYDYNTAAGADAYPRLQVTVKRAGAIYQSSGILDVFGEVYDYADNYEEDDLYGLFVWLPAFNNGSQFYTSNGFSKGGTNKDTLPASMWCGASGGNSEPFLGGVTSSGAAGSNPPGLIEVGFYDATGATKNGTLYNVNVHLVVTVLPPDVQQLDDAEKLKYGQAADKLVFGIGAGASETGAFGLPRACY